MKPKFQAAGCVPLETYERNFAYCKSLGLPWCSEKERPPLAVVGGGHSVKDHLDELAAWPGDIWALGSVWKWLDGLGIKSTAFCVDPQHELMEMIRGTQHAILATCVHPSVFDMLIETGARIEVFEPFIPNGEKREGMQSPAIVTSATACPQLSIQMGYRDVSFFGLDSNYQQTTHAYQDTPDPFMIRVVSAGEPFMTGVEFVQQADFLAEAIRALPKVLKNRSGGLLKSFVENGTDWEATHCTHLMLDREASRKYIEAELEKRRAA